MVWTLLPCNNILPAEFTQDISNYELVCKLMQNLNQLAQDLKNAYDELSTMIETGDEKNKTLIEQIQSELQLNINNAITDYNNKINNIITDYNNKINALDIKTQTNLNNAVNKLNSQINFLESKWNLYFSMLQTQINQNNSYIKSWVESELNSLKNWLEENGNQYGYIKNPFTNQIQNIQLIINDIAKELRENAMNCQEWDLNNLTCAEIDNRFVSAHNYDFHSKKYFWINFHYLFYSPENGSIFNTHQIISWLVSQHLHGFTAQDFDNENYSAQYLDGADWTAYMFDWQELNGGNTAQQYDDLNYTAQYLDSLKYTAYKWDYNKIN